uniref:MYND-type domain-containing protein n=1 Tax=Ditylenchus dipsaci TaxID=166011 RepID=A0A915DWS9_9BILA
MKLNLSLKEKAFCLALDENSASHYCSLCVKSDRHCKLSRCSSCKLIFYCSPECQKADWCLHKQECKFIKNFNGLCDESVRLVLRLHAKSKLEHEEPAPDYAGPSRTFKDLMSHTTLTKNDEYRPWKMFFRKFATATDISDDRLKELYSKMSINCFGLNNENTAKIGLALHTRLSAINHSCRPRTRIAYVKDEAIMVPTNTASQDIEHTIDQAQHSYINDMLPKEERRKLLKMKMLEDTQNYNKDVGRHNIISR